MRFVEQDSHEFARDFREIAPQRDFEKSLKNYLERLEKLRGENEDSLVANALNPFFQKLDFDTRIKVKHTGNSEIDLALLEDGEIRIIIEAKKPDSAEFPSRENLVCKAFCEALFYLWLKRDSHQFGVNFVVLTNFYEFYIFGEEALRRLLDSPKIKKICKAYGAGKIGKTDEVYARIGEVLREDFAGSPLRGIHFDLRDKKSHNLAAKALSATFLLQKERQGEIGERFYTELLYILGLRRKLDSKGNKTNKLEPNLDEAGAGSFYAQVAAKVAEKLEGGGGQRQHNVALNAAANPAALSHAANESAAGESHATATQSHAANPSESAAKSAAHAAQKTPPDESQPDKNPLNEDAISLLIIWLNRILFLRLIQANLQRFAPEDENLAFLKTAKIPNFRRLNALFFEVLAKDFDARKEHKDDLGDLERLPYLNSSLFTKQPIEEAFFEIKELDESKKMPLMTGSALKNHAKNGAKLGLLEYLFLFLDCFDYARDTKDASGGGENGGKNGDGGSGSGEGGGENADENAAKSEKALIKSSVLGLVFERLNAYSEGSFYTPSEITEFMARDALERVVVEKFNAKNPQWKVANLANIREEIRGEIRDNRANEEEIKQKYRALLERIKICDPSVGSGHFLVAALNEMLRIYCELGLADLAILGANLAVEDDEILLFDRDKTPFSYRRPKSPTEPQHALQKAMFELKKSIIENNLFGVDINPNSCNIARLRLWIELLKSAYYTDFSDTDAHHLQTLPNIDINVKCGNSLISRFSLKDSLAHIPNIKKQIEAYKKLVADYKNADRPDPLTLTRTTKQDIAAQIENLKKIFVLSLKDEKMATEIQMAIDKHIDEFGMYGLDDRAVIESFRIQPNIWKQSNNLSEEEQEAADLSFVKIRRLRKKLDAVKSGAEYKDAFEWRFEFPEVLDENGDFVGFDLVIGNPPYFQVPKGIFPRERFPYSEGKDRGKQNLYKVFVEQGYNLLGENGVCALITQSSVMCDLSAQFTRELLLTETQISQILEFPKNAPNKKGKVFERVLQGTCIVIFAKRPPQDSQRFKISINNDKTTLKAPNFEVVTQKDILKNFALYEFPLIKRGEMPIIQKMRRGEKLKSALAFSLQGNINTIHLNRIKSREKTGIYIVKGANIHRYRLDGNFMDCVKTEEILGFCQTNAKAHIIAMQGITGTTDKFRIHCTLIESKNAKSFVFLDSTKILFVECREKAKLLVGLLNSRLLDWLFRKTSTNNNINIYEIESLPLPPLDESNAALVAQITTLVEQVLAKGGDEKLEREIDALVFALYGLNADEIAVVAGAVAGK